jgi:hypothetical protein
MILSLSPVVNGVVSVVSCVDDIMVLSVCLVVDEVVSVVSSLDVVMVLVVIFSVVVCEDSVVYSVVHFQLWMK